MTHVEIPKNYKPLNNETLIDFINGKENLKKIINTKQELKITEVCDGNLNLVFFADS